jgi:AMMECR1 domain-containing protein
MRGYGSQLCRCVAYGSLLLFALVPVNTTHASGTGLTLPGLVRKTMAFYFERSDVHSSEMQTYQNFIRHLPAASPNYPSPKGVFVTLSQHGKPRACWGSAFPHYQNLREATVYATLGALTKEYRYKPIHATEWRQLKPQVTVVKALQPITNLQGQNPLHDGLMVRQNGRTGVILPGEATDAVYQLTLCKMKAGIQPGQKFQLYRMMVDVYH